MEYIFRTPVEVMRGVAERAKKLRLDKNITQAELAARAGIAVGTLKRFERIGEIQFNHLLRIMLVLGRLDEFDALLSESPMPSSLFDVKEVKPRQRARSK